VQVLLSTTKKAPPGLLTGRRFFFAHGTLVPTLVTLFTLQHQSLTSAQAPSSAILLTRSTETETAVCEITSRPASVHRRQI